MVTSPFLTQGLREAIAMAGHVTGVVVGGLALTGGITASSGVLLSATRLSLSDAMLLTSMLGFLVYVGVAIWGFSAPKNWRPALVICLLALLMMVIAVGITPKEVLE